MDLLKRFPSERVKSAWHEAGHALMAVDFGSTVLFSTVSKHAGSVGYTGVQTLLDGAGGDPNAQLREPSSWVHRWYVWRVLAGPVAEAMMVHSWEPDASVLWTVTPGSDDDRALVEPVLREAYHGDLVTAATALLEAIVEVYDFLNQHRPALTALAEELHRHTTLDTDTIAEVLAPWYPNLPRSDEDSLGRQAESWRAVRSGPFPRRAGARATEGTD